MFASSTDQEAGGYFNMLAYTDKGRAAGNTKNLDINTYWA